MTIYLVDMENIPHAWANLLDICGGDDRIVLFYTDRVSQVPLILMEKVTKSRVEMEYIKCYDGPNGLDFQLVTEMGYRIAQNPEADYVIVSQDHGFDVVVQYWSGRGARAKRIVPSGGRSGGVFPQYTSGGGIEFRDVDVSNPQNVKEFLCWKLSNKVPKKEIVTISEILLEAMEQGDGYSAERRLSCRFTYLDKTLRRQYGEGKGAKLRDQIKAVSHDVFVLNLDGEASRRQETAGEASEDRRGAVYAQLAALGLSASKTEEVTAIVMDVLSGGAKRQRSAIYRRMLSAFGRAEGTETYRAAKEIIGQMVLEQTEAQE